MIENKSTSNLFTDEQKKQIKLVNSGDKIYFENIKAIAIDGTLRNYGTLMLTIE